MNMMNFQTAVAGTKTAHRKMMTVILSSKKPLQLSLRDHLVSQIKLMAFSERDQTFNFIIGGQH